MKEIKVVELFAGVGGFRLGLTQASDKYKIVWSNQWEPNSKLQEATYIYIKRFGSENHSNVDIAKVPISEIPDHNLLVGGFPCQDYSVARTLKQATGIEGKKGVLWWQIHRILQEKKKKPEFLLLENVDRLLKSPVSQRGRDFALMLSSLSDLGYIVEWRVINAADYGMPQRRRRVFLLGYYKTTKIFQQINNYVNPIDWVTTDGIMVKAFPIETTPMEHENYEIKGDLIDISLNFNNDKRTKSPFENSGLIINRNIHTLKSKPKYNGERKFLKHIILMNGAVPEKYYLEDNSIEKWKYHKYAKKHERVNKATGIKYNYSEGSMSFPDPLDKPARTIVTGEGGTAPSRFKHVIQMPDGRLRRLTPIELERLNMFPDDHTRELTDIKRAFMMGNALVVGVVENIAKTLINFINGKQ